MGYLTYKTKAILDFYNLFIANKITIISSSDYINNLMFFSTILVIIISFIVYYLMRFKNKPRRLYILLMIFYFLLIIVLFFVKANLNILVIRAIDSKTIRLVRDIVRIVFLLEVISLFPIIIRAIGFNIKKFNFEKDIEQLNIEAKDSEEVEVNIDLSANNLERSGRRTLRELKYYYKENKAFINIILSIFLIVVLCLIFYNHNFVNKVYNEGEYINSTYLNFNVDSSYITSYDNNHKMVAKNNTIYVIVKLNIKANYNNNYTIDTNKFILDVGDKTFLPTKKYYSYFTNIGVGYKSQVLSYEDYSNYIIVYNIDNTYQNNKMIFRYDDTYDNIYKISLEPINLD